ncbi:MAG: hypothetical protein KKA07_10005 [Bacteroidetes bacterium]|nr:hypothetical protein [Bacteroidota bacterium]MBU1719394.1 hypothetical protein [Bacteroidota bacterium]
MIRPLSYHIILSIVFILVFSVELFPQDKTDDPALYNNAIVKEYNKVVEKSLCYSLEQVHNDQDEEVAKARTAVVEQINTAIGTLKDMEGFKGDSKLKNEALDILKLYLDAFRVDFKDANELKKGSNDSYEAMEKYLKSLTKAEKKLQEAGAQFQKAQQAFAEKNNLKIKSGNTTTNDVLNQVAMINAYCRDFFLIRFKISKINAAYLDALNEKKIAVMDAKRKEMEEFTAASEKQIKEIKPYEGEKIYYDQMLEYLAYYSGIATKEYLDLYNIRNSTGRRGSGDIQKYNEIIQGCNQKTPEMDNKIQEAELKFRKKYTPKG